MAEHITAPTSDTPRWKGEAVGHFVGLDAEILHTIHCMLAMALPEQDCAQSSAPEERVYRLHFFGGKWRGRPSATEELYDTNLILEFGREGVSVRFVPMLAEPMAPRNIEDVPAEREPEVEEHVDPPKEPA